MLLLFSTRKWFRKVIGEVMSEALDKLKQEVADTKADVHRLVEAFKTTNATLDEVKKQLEAKATEHDDEDLSKLAEDLQGAQDEINNAIPNAAQQPPATGGGDQDGDADGRNVGATTPPAGDTTDTGATPPPQPPPAETTTE